MDLKVSVDNLVYLPTYANSTDACMDIKLKIEGGTSYILPHALETYCTGLKVAIPEDHVMLVFPRSSTGFKLHCMLANTTGVIDAGYRDEIKLALYNFGHETVELKDGQRIAQFVVIPRPKLNLINVKDDESFRKGDRGGGLGSSGVM